MAMGRASMGKQIATARGSKNWEGSTKDMAEDRKMAKSRGMTMSEWESSAADRKHDAKKMAKGGMVRGDGCCRNGKTKGKMC